MKLYLAIFTFIKSLFEKPETIQASDKKPLKLNLQFFAEGDPPGGESGGDKGGEGGSGTKPDPEDKPFATFNSKEELDKRLNRAQKAGQKALAEQLGFDSVEAMEKAISSKKNPEGGTGDKGGKGPDKDVDVDAIIEQKLQEDRQKTFKRLLTAEVKLAAKELDFADYEDALKLGDFEDVKEDANGEITGVKEVLEALAKKKPHLLKKAGNGNFGADAGSSRKSEQERLEQLKKEAQSRGTYTASVNDPWKR
ncbi:hypothetical protein KP77_25090 [Jeotgalibacillus alimentarius]|uniref:Scaffolding protein n=1 Tax=Jeotgalibacillus alimentarius TaxID=135826 RepID=A0A0C2R9D3_9BACL|nr:hypothetical protein [Jeotgalibacillus alimentarius]KIL46940.1 hypothetical protein KP77_25090 [Jeotgalibacillus alimentarius]